MGIFCVQYQNKPFCGQRIATGVSKVQNIKHQIGPILRRNKQ